MKTWRLLNSGHLPGSLNMAIDRALLELYARGTSPPTLRFYQWCPPAVSLGYFQRSHRLEKAVCQRLGIDIVRRPTGGKAVLHQGDLTYAIVAGAEDGLPTAVEATYRVICEGLILGFRSLGIEATLGQESVKSQQPDVCFLRAVVGDIVYGGRKFVGSAQTWQGTSVLQHGSIILEPQVETLVSIWGSGYSSSDKFFRALTSRLTSMQEIVGHQVSVSEVERAITRGIGEVLGVVLEPKDLTPEELSLAEEFAREQFAKEQPTRKVFGFGKKKVTGLKQIMSSGPR